MQFKKIFKYLPIAVIAASLVVAANDPPYSINNSDYSKEQILNTDQKVSDTKDSDQLEYIRNDVAKQDGVANSIASIEFPDVSSSADHSAALIRKKDGSTLLYTWGFNQYGQLGNGKTSPTFTPTPVTIPDSVSPIKQIALGGQFSAVLLDDGSMYMWGDNRYGQLGFTANSNSNTTPIPVDNTNFNGKKITQIALGEYHSAALLEGGSLYTWGFNENGQLGDGLYDSKDTPEVTLLKGLIVDKIALGSGHSAALTNENILYTWGLNTSGQMGDGKTDSTTHPFIVGGLGSKKIIKIALGNRHSAALLDGGSLYMWGNNYYGQLGSTTNNVTNKPNLPAPVPALNSKIVTEIALGFDYSAAILKDGSRYMWGYNFNGELGLGTGGPRIYTPTPTPVTALSGKKTTRIASGSNHCAAILEDGSLYMWGSNAHGQLGFQANSDKNVNPTRSPLGAPSEITANSAITAKQAYDQFWVGNSFNLAGFKNSFNFINISNTDTTDQEITMIDKPTYNDGARTVTIKVKIKRYYDENGLPIANTAAKAMTIGGFKEAIKTKITIKTSPLNSVVVDKWLDYVTVDEKINRAKLQEFLTLTDVPNDAIFTITDSNAVNKTGVLTFKITTNKVIEGSGATINTPSDLDPFSISLNLTPRITEMTAITIGYPSSLTVTALESKLFDGTGLVKDFNELKKYMAIIAPVDGAKYYLVENSWVPHTGDGTVKFDIYVDKYYDSNGDQKTGSATTAASKVSFNLNLQPEASTIALKSTLPEIRIDKFETYIESEGPTVATSKLGEFFDLTNIPSTATFSIANVDIDAFDASFTRNHLTFDLMINKFNQGSPVTPQTYTHNYELILGTQHQPTAITDKTTYDQMIRVDKVANELNTLKDEALVIYLSNFLDFTSIPNGAVITVKNVIPNDATGKLSFEVVPSKIYNSISDLATPAPGQFTLNLQFNIKNPPTDMVINANYAKIRIDEFANKINYLKSEALYNYLVPNYVTATNVDATKLTARIISQDNQTGKIKISLTIPSYYDVDSNLVEEPKSYSFDYELNPKYQQTIIKTLDESAYPKDITPAQFKQRIIDGGAAVSGDDYTLTKTNITFLKKFLSFESIPTNTVYTLTWNAEQRDGTTGVLSFNLSLNQYYSADGDLITNALLFNNLTLNLLGSMIPVWPETMITTKLNAPSIISSQRFLDIVYADGEVDNGKLSLYLDGLQTIPASGDITNIAIQTENEGIATFSLNVSHHYDTTGALKGPKSFNFNLRLTTKHIQTNITVLPRGSYPIDFTTVQFKQQLIDDGAVAQGNLYTLSNANISLLHRFLDLTTVPPSTEYILTWNDEKTSDVTGRACFNLIIDKYYNADGDLVTNAAQPFNDLVLWLANIDTPEIRPATNLKTKCGSPEVASANAFIQMIYTNDNHLIYSQLNIFVDGLLTIPTGAKVTVSYIAQNNSIATFQVILSRYYDGVSADMINEEKAYNFEVNVKYTAPVNDQFQWWWILVAIGAVAVIGVLTWLMIKRQKERQTAVKRIQQQKETSKTK